MSDDYRFQKLPPEPLSSAKEHLALPQNDDVLPPGSLYPADETVKYRILAQADAAGHHIVYRRVKRINELVIDGYVYDTYKALIEFPHTLRAELDGISIEAGMEFAPYSFIDVNDETVARTLRLS